jgi:hypothetical protein
MTEFVQVSLLGGREKVDGPKLQVSRLTRFLFR